MSLHQRLQGHWRRDWLTAPGVLDDTTRVHWMQAGNLYADLRIPLERPDLSGFNCLADMPAEALQQLAQAEGFAGEISLDGPLCTWHRMINWHGAPDGIDAGALAFAADGALIETGVHADYSERWLQEAAGPACGFRLTSPGLTGFLVTVGGRFVLGLGQPSDVGAMAPKGAALFSNVYAFGHWQEDAGHADLATNPLAEGRTILTRDNGFFHLQYPDFYGEIFQVSLDVADRQESADETV